MCDTHPRRHTHTQKTKLNAGMQTRGQAHPSFSFLHPQLTYHCQALPALDSLCGGSLHKTLSCPTFFKARVSKHPCSPSLRYYDTHTLSSNQIHTLTHTHTHTYTHTRMTAVDHKLHDSKHIPAPTHPQQLTCLHHHFLSLQALKISHANARHFQRLQAQEDSHVSAKHFLHLQALKHAHANAIHFQRLQTQEDSLVSAKHILHLQALKISHANARHFQRLQTQEDSLVSAKHFLLLQALKISHANARHFQRLQTQEDSLVSAKHFLLLQALEFSRGAPEIALLHLHRRVSSSLLLCLAEGTAQGVNYERPAACTHAHTHTICCSKEGAAQGRG